MDFDKFKQQDLLRYAMTHLSMNRKQFAEEIATTKRALDNWLLPTESAEHRPMPKMARKLICLILEQHFE
ncbi:transcriptional regulator [Cupriavidus sp. TMH.W2]|uniref:transcriptional regulator n=1 Tax=Cupriavidus sp. TMH.W2 TaxID=3434465 RepID=UPI003D77D8F1